MRGQLNTQGYTCIQHVVNDIQDIWSSILQVDFEIPIREFSVSIGVCETMLWAECFHSGLLRRLARARHARSSVLARNEHSHIAYDGFQAALHPTREHLFYAWHGIVHGLCHRHRRDKDSRMLRRRRLDRAGEQVRLRRFRIFKGHFRSLRATQNCS